MKTALLALVLLFQFPSVPVAPGPRGSIEGVVTAANGVPIPGADVTAFWSPSPMVYSPGDLPRTTSDSNGRFVLRDIGAGGYRVQVSAPGYVRQEFGAAYAGYQSSNTGTVLNLTPGETKEGITVRLIKEGIVSGRTTSTTGSPLLGMEVYVLRKTFDQNGWVTFVTEGTRGETNDRGEFRITGLPPGQYFVRASSQPLLAGRRATSESPGSSPGEYTPTYYPGVVDSGSAVRVEVKSGAESGNIDIALPRTPLFAIRGRVVDPTDSKPPTRPMLEAIPARSDFVSVVGGSVSPYRPDRTFEFPENAPGTYWIEASLPGPPLTPEQRQLMSTPGADFSFPVSPRGIALVTVTNSDVENVEISIVRDLRVTGSVSVDGATLPSSELTAIKVEFRSLSAGRINPKPTGVTTISPDARFTSGIISPGEYRATLSGLPTGFYLKESKLGNTDASTQTITLTTSQPPSLDFVLAKGGDLVGTVMDSDTRAVPNQQVVLVPTLSNRPDLYRTVTTDARGLFAIQGIAPGDYRAYAWKTLAPFQYFDPDFMREFADKGTAVRISGSSTTTSDVTLIN
jgi:hypothetical protein